MPAEGGEPVQITSNESEDRYPHWSPDGREIAYQSERDRNTWIYVLPRERGELQGKVPRQMTFEAGSFDGARWSPRGDAIAYGRLRGGGVLVVPASGGEARELSSFGDVPLWSEDGETVYFRSDEGFWSVSASGGEPELLVRLDDPSKLPLRYEWSADGERFYFALTEYESDVWVMELETTPR